jgi:hypothetical protein
MVTLCRTDLFLDRVAIIHTIPMHQCGAVSVLLQEARLGQRAARR